jgi:antitoxin (DNA-binding transcriptional repressor) of toxin-antitoxin stability system
MEVKTGVLRNHLSKYLKRVRQSGNPIVVLDRDVPIAEIRPYRASSSRQPADTWNSRRRFEQEFGELTDDFELPKRTTSPDKQCNPLD